MSKPKAPQTLGEASQLVTAASSMAVDARPADRRLALMYADLLDDAGYHKAAVRIRVLVKEREDAIRT